MQAHSNSNAQSGGFCRHKLLSQQWIVGMVVNPQQREVIVAARGTAPGTPCCIVTIGLDKNWDIKANWTLSQTSMISCITMLPENKVFAVGKLTLSSALCR